MIEMVNLIKVMLFDEQMNYILLFKDGVLSPFGGQINRAESLTASVRQIMTPMISIPPINQPVWKHIRTEYFSSSVTNVHVFYGKLNMDELLSIEAKQKAVLVEIDRMRSGKYPHPISHRLRYLIPMAIVFDSMESKYWPQP
jgi:hypothetical protein